MNSVVKRTSFSVAVLILSLWCAAPARADFMLIPAGLNTGDQFRVVFISSVGRDALSPDISVYDQFIAGLAAAAGLDTYFGTPVTWQVLGSTSSVSAISRVPLTSPGLYLLSGIKVADSGADLWDGTIDTGIFITERGFAESSRIVYTGTLQDGSVSFDDPLGGRGLPFVQVGLADFIVTDRAWVSAGPVDGSPQRQFYGVSSVLTVPSVAAVPEPTSLALLLVGVAGLAGSTLVRRHFQSRYAHNGRLHHHQEEPRLDER